MNDPGSLLVYFCRCLYINGVRFQISEPLSKCGTLLATLHAMSVGSGIGKL